MCSQDWRLNMMKSQSKMEWWQDLFDTDWSRIFAYKNKDAPKEAKAVEKLLGLLRGSKVLDLGCGEGRISMRLARRGYQVTGLDFSHTVLNKANKIALCSHLNIKWIQQDMREIDIHNQYDAVISIFTSFGYFEEESDDRKVLQSIYKALKSDGKLLIDLENIFFISRAAQIYGGEVMYRPIENYRGWVEETTDFDPVDQRVKIKLRFWLPKYKAIKTAQASYRAYTLVELRNLLISIGFVIYGVYGDFKLNEYSLDSERMIVLCGKVPQ